MYSEKFLKQLDSHLLCSFDEFLGLVSDYYLTNSKILKSTKNCAGLIKQLLIFKKKLAEVHDCYNYQTFQMNYKGHSHNNSNKEKNQSTQQQTNILYSLSNIILFDIKEFKNDVKQKLAEHSFNKKGEKIFSRQNDPIDPYENNIRLVDCLENTNPNYYDKNYQEGQRFNTFNKKDKHSYIDENCRNESNDFSNSQIDRTDNDDTFIEEDSAINDCLSGIFAKKKFFEDSDQKISHNKFECLSDEIHSTNENSHGNFNTKKHQQAVTKRIDKQAIHENKF